MERSITEPPETERAESELELVAREREAVGGAIALVEGGARLEGGDNAEDAEGKSSLLSLALAGASTDGGDADDLSTQQTNFSHSLTVFPFIV